MPDAINTLKVYLSLSQPANAALLSGPSNSTPGGNMFTQMVMGQNDILNVEVYPFTLTGGNLVSTALPSGMLVEIGAKAANAPDGGELFSTVCATQAVDASGNTYYAGVLNLEGTALATALTGLMTLNAVLNIRAANGVGNAATLRKTLAWTNVTVLKDVSSDTGANPTNIVSVFVASALTGNISGSTLDSIPTVGAIAVNTALQVLIGGQVSLYVLRSGTAVTASPNVIRPADYNATTNPVEWVLSLPVSTQAPVPGVLFIEMNGNDEQAEAYLDENPTGGSKSYPFATGLAAFNAARAAGGNWRLQFGVGAWTMRLPYVSGTHGVGVDWPANIQPAGAGLGLTSLTIYGGGFDVAAGDTQGSSLFITDAGYKSFNGVFAAGSITDYETTGNAGQGGSVTLTNCYGIAYGGISCHRAAGNVTLLDCTVNGHAGQEWWSGSCGTVKMTRCIYQTVSGNVQDMSIDGVNACVSGTQFSANGIPSSNTVAVFS